MSQEKFLLLSFFLLLYKQFILTSKQGTWHNNYTFPVYLVSCLQCSDFWGDGVTHFDEAPTYPTLLVDREMVLLRSRFSIRFDSLSTAPWNFAENSHSQHWRRHSAEWETLVKMSSKTPIFKSSTPSTPSSILGQMSYFNFLGYSFFSSLLFLYSHFYYLFLYLDIYFLKALFVFPYPVPFPYHLFGCSLARLSAFLAMLSICTNELCSILRFLRTRKPLLSHFSLI